MRRTVGFRFTLYSLWLVAAGACCGVRSTADDWPQWMGPQRDNVWRESGLLAEIPAGGPRVVWRAPVAGGYAGPAVVGDRVYLMDYVTADNVKVPNFERKEFTGTERVLCLSAVDGTEIWKHEYPVKYEISYPAGPRCTPLVAGGKVYCLGAEGQLTCLDASKGDVVWQKNFVADYGAKTPLWGFACHPLLDGDNLICVVGGEGSHAVAFQKDTGAEVWKTGAAGEQGYSPPTIITAAGVRQLILVRPDAVGSVDPATGKEYWSVPYEATNGCVVMSPVVSGDYLYVGGYNNKSELVKLSTDKPGAEIAWRDKGKDAIAPVNVQPYAENGVMYGVDQKGVLRAIQLPEGKQLWETAEPFGERPLPSGTAFLVRSGDRCFLFNDAGELLLGKLTPEGYQQLGKAKVIEPTNEAHGRDVVWSMPALARRCAFLRNDKECVCIDLAGEGG